MRVRKEGTGRADGIKLLWGSFQDGGNWSSWDPPPLPTPKDGWMKCAQDDVGSQKKKSALILLP